MKDKNLLTWIMCLVFGAVGILISVMWIIADYSNIGSHKTIGQSSVEAFFEKGGGIPILILIVATVSVIFGIYKIMENRADK